MLKSLALVFIIFLGVLARQISTPIPRYQFRPDKTLVIYAEPDDESQILSYRRAGTAVYIYSEELVDAQGRFWGETDGGWIMMGSEIEPAVVQYQAQITEPIEIRDFHENSRFPATLEPDALMGVVALWEDEVLLYTLGGAGWADTADIIFLDPSPDLSDFVEQIAYIKVLQADFFIDPRPDDTLFTKPLGEKLSILNQREEWVLARTEDQRFGWTLAENLDMLPRAQGRGILNAGPVNLRQTFPDGDVLTILDFQAEILVIGENAAGDWLYIGVQGEGDGIRGWVAAEFVDHDLEDLPVCEQEGQCAF